MRAPPRALGSAALVLAAGCSAPSVARPGAVTEGVVAARDGVPIAYDVRGTGEPALLFIHCWCGNRAFWKHQLDEFARDHQVIALDLPGHGASGRERKDWTVTALADDVRAVLEEVDPEHVVLVGNSMGGPIGLEVARRSPDWVVGIVGVDTLHDVEQTFAHEAAERVAERYDADFEGSMRNFIGALVHPDTDEELRAWIVTEACKADHRAAVALLRDFPNVDAKALLQGAGVPVRCINAAARQDRAPATAVEKNRKYGDFDAVILEGAGHFPMLEKPEDFNARLRQILEELPSL